MNFSDSIAVKRKSYRSKNRRRQKHDDGGEEVGDLSDREDESVERKLARLRREVEELKDEMTTRENDESKDTDVEQGQGSEPVNDGVQELSRALDNLYASSRSAVGPHSAASMLSQRLMGNTTSSPPAAAAAAAAQTAPAVKSKAAETPSAIPAQSSSSSGVLSHAAAFDSRLALIEASMGISNASNPFVPDGTSEAALQPVLPSLDHLTSRLSTLTNLLVGPAPASAVPTIGTAPPTTTISTPNLEALSARVHKLTTDAEALAAARKRALDAAKAAQTARISSSTHATTNTNPDGAAADPAAAAAAATTTTSDTSASSSSATEVVDPVANQRDEQATKIQALYATLPTIQSLHPLLPSVLERLRSLRAIHAGAAQAAESLDEIERRQAEMNREVDAWHDGLRVVEEKMGQGESAMKGNIELVEPWVRDLERRLGVLGSE